MFAPVRVPASLASIRARWKRSTLRPASARMSSRGDARRLAHHERGAAAWRPRGGRQSLGGSGRLAGGWLLGSRRRARERGGFGRAVRRRSPGAGSPGGAAGGSLVAGSQAGFLPGPGPDGPRAAAGPAPPGPARAWRRLGRQVAGRRRAGRARSSSAAARRPPAAPARAPGTGRSRARRRRPRRRRAELDLERLVGERSRAPQLADRDDLESGASPACSRTRARAGDDGQACGSSERSAGPSSSSRRWSAARRRRRLDREDGHRRAAPQPGRVAGPRERAVGRVEVAVLHLDLARPARRRGSAPSVRSAREPRRRGRVEPRGT